MRKSEGKGELWITRCTEEDNIKMDFKEIGLGVVDWIHLVDDCLMNMVMNIPCP